MEFRRKAAGIGVCAVIALASQWLGSQFPLVGGAVFALIIGLVLAFFIKDSYVLDAGLAFTSKKILQYAVILLGFGLNLGVIWETGKQSLPIILATISTALLVAYLGHKYFAIEAPIAILVGVGSSICGGSAIAATAPVIKAKDEEVAQAISVIFFFNLLAALLFPSLGQILGFSTQSGQEFGLFVGTAINDTSSVTAAASTWDNLYQLGSQTLDTGVTVKLTRTLAIIPITLVLAILQAKKARSSQSDFSLKTVFPTFILFFLGASLFTTIWTGLGYSQAIFAPIKDLSKFFITMAMAAIGLKTDLLHLLRTGGRAILLGASCWISITCISLLLQYLLGMIG
ncbi:TPA: YeiH family putative sulfate export transporter [Streptococcus suis]|nr:YeiH family putative sulfate export transporter [Streptococcus suis]